MCTGIHDGIRFETMRQVNVRAGVPKTELQDAHSRHREIPAQLFYLWSDGAEIFCNERKIAQSLAQGMEEIVIRSLRPTTIDCRLFSRRDLPASLESAEVVETDDVALLQSPLHPLNPPIVAALTKDVPAIKRIAPALARLAEEIRRTVVAVRKLEVEIVDQPHAAEHLQHEREGGDR